MANNKGIIFYDNWCDMVNQFYDDGDKDAACQLAFAIVRLYSTGELIKLPRKDLDIMLQYTIKSGLDTQIKNYDTGIHGGRPSKLDADDQIKISEMRRDGWTAKRIAEFFGVGEATIKRSKGWKDGATDHNYTYQKIVSDHVSYLNQEEEEEKEFDLIRSGQNIDALQDYLESERTEIDLNTVAAAYGIKPEQLLELAQLYE